MALSFIPTIWTVGAIGPAFVGAASAFMACEALSRPRCWRSRLAFCGNAFMASLGFGAALFLVTL